MGGTFFRDVTTTSMGTVKRVVSRDAHDSEDVLDRTGIDGIKYANES